MKTIVGNWKMNQDLAALKEFFLAIESLKAQINCYAWVAPQFIHIPLVKELAFTLGQIQVGAQNCSSEEAGAFTGEVSAASLADIGTSFVIIGHSERRQLFNEQEELLNRKIQKALQYQLKVIYCVGETLDERNQEQTFKKLEYQLQQGLKDIPTKNLLIAYEPIWAIGTGQSASPEQAQEVHAFIRQSFPTTPLLYGGSVKPDNIQELLAEKDIDGALVGGASLKGKDFAQLCLAASRF